MMSKDGSLGLSLGGTDPPERARSAGKPGEVPAIIGPWYRPSARGSSTAFAASLGRGYAFEIMGASRESAALSEASSPALPLGLGAPPDTDLPELERGLETLSLRAIDFARTPVADKVLWLREILNRFHELGPRMAHDACTAKGIELGTPLEG